jgi:hypothetical protein
MYGIVLDPKSSFFEEGTGRLLLVKWMNRPYVDCTHEYEQDLILNNVKYLDQLASFYLRDQKPWQGWDRNTRRDICTLGIMRIRNNFEDPCTAPHKYRDWSRDSASLGGSPGYQRYQKISRMLRQVCESQFVRPESLPCFAAKSLERTRVR